MKAQAGIVFAVVALSVAGCGHMVTTHEHVTDAIRKPSGDVPLQPDNPGPECDVSIPRLHAVEQYRL